MREINIQTIFWIKNLFRQYFRLSSIIACLLLSLLVLSSPMETIDASNYVLRTVDVSNSHFQKEYQQLASQLQTKDHQKWLLTAMKMMSYQCDIEQMRIIVGEKPKRVHLPELRAIQKRYGFKRPTYLKEEIQQYAYPESFGSGFEINYKNLDYLSRLYEAKLWFSPIHQHLTFQYARQALPLLILIVTTYIVVDDLSKLRSTKMKAIIMNSRQGRKYFVLSKTLAYLFFISIFFLLQITLVLIAEGLMFGFPSFDLPVLLSNQSQLSSFSAYLQPYSHGMNIVTTPTIINEQVQWISLAQAVILMIGLNGLLISLLIQILMLARGHKWQSILIVAFLIILWAISPVGHDQPLQLLNPMNYRSGPSVLEGLQVYSVWTAYLVLATEGLLLFVLNTVLTRRYCFN